MNRKPKKMPHKEPNFIQAVLKFLVESPAMLAAITAIARGLWLIYPNGKSDKVNFKAIIADAFLCTMLTVCIAPAMDFISSYFGIKLPEKTDLAFAVFIGYIGTQTVRELIIKVINKRLGFSDKKETSHD